MKEEEHRQTPEMEHLQYLMEHPELQEENVCNKCGGLGYTAEHDLPSRHGEDGECVSCPVQVQCDCSFIS